MNELEARGQKWFWFALILFVGYECWLILMDILLAYQVGDSKDLTGSIGAKVFIIMLVSAAFILMDKGYQWPKWTFSSIIVIISATSIYKNYRVLSRDIESADLITSLYVNIFSTVIFFLFPALLLVLSSSINAFLHCRTNEKNGNPDLIDRKLNQIGKNE